MTETDHPRVSLSVVAGRPDFIEAQARLNALPGSFGNRLEDQVWRFRLPNQPEVAIDFGCFVLIQGDHNHASWCQERIGDLVTVSKLVWLESAESTSIAGYQLKIAGLAVFWAALARNNIVKLTGDNLPDVLTFMLMYRWERGSYSLRNRPASAVAFKGAWALNAWGRSLRDIGFNLIAPGLTSTHIKKALTQLIPDLTQEELTYPDWKAGGSYNQLTLDHGQYYVEHCLRFFEDHIALATALASTFRTAPQFARAVGVNKDSANSWLLSILEGRSHQSIHESLVARNKSFRSGTVERMHGVVTEHFATAYRSALFVAKLLKHSYLLEFVTTLGLDPLQSNIDRLRIITKDWLQQGQEDETRRLLKGCLPPVTFANFRRVLDLLRAKCDQNEPSKIPSVRDYLAMGLQECCDPHDTHNRFPRQLIHMVEHAGLTILVALTGWRKSEYGYPISAIRRFANDDKLDQYSFPWRYHVDWYVFKTSGKVLQHREVTASTVFLSELLHSLVGAQAGQPSLYRSNACAKDAHMSGKAVRRSVTGLWQHFVEHYADFRTIDNQQRWIELINIERSGSPLTEAQRSEKQDLLSIRSAPEWSHLKPDRALVEAWRRCREEWPALNFYFMHSESSDKKEWLPRYRQGLLRADWAGLLDVGLCSETQAWLHKLTEADCRSNMVTRVITQELVAESLYPTPHAFRHMWAEAVYRRFDGDAGWMIRSQFKHVSRAMWLSYVRDKDNRGGHQIAKTRVISSLVKNYFDRNGKGYSGLLHIWLRRLAGITKVMTAEEQGQFAERIAIQEITDIKANPWGYCLLKRRTRSKARCAEMGEPQRHNASPDLCLGCVHNLMQSENVEWILLHMYSHVEALRNANVPKIFKESSYKLVKNGAKQVRILDPNHEALPGLQQVQDDFLQGRVR